MKNVSAHRVRVEMLPKGRMVDGVLSPGMWEEVRIGGTQEGARTRSPEAKAAVSRAPHRAAAKRSTGKAVINILVYLIITGSILVGLPRGLSRALNTDFPMAAITSGSMWPALKVGSLVFIEGISGRDAKVGDIIVFRNSSGTFTVHRVVKLAKNTLTTKGDANFREDEPVRYEDVIGRTVVVRGEPLAIPYVGSITVFASNLKQ